MPGRRHNQTRRATTRKKRRSRKPFVPPSSAEEFFAMSEKAQDDWENSGHVVTEMRSEKMSLPKASRKYSMDPRKVIRLRRQALRKTGKGRWVAKASDRLLGVFGLPTRKGNREVATLDSRHASAIGKYWNAVDKALGPAEDTTALRSFEGEYVVDAGGEHVPFLTDLVELKQQYSAGNMSFETIYARRA
jgi:hypothetical protein